MKYSVYDNPNVFDRFTILDHETGDYYGASEHPFAPNGFGQYAGNTAQDYWFHAYGASWRKNCDEKKCIRFAVTRFKAQAEDDVKWIGIKRNPATLPEDVKKYIKQIFTHEEAA